MIYRKELVGIFEKDTYIGNYETIVCVVLYYIYLFGLKIGEVQEITKN